jgi:hypothetical protein
VTQILGCSPLALAFNTELNEKGTTTTTTTTMRSQDEAHQKRKDQRQVHFRYGFMLHCSGPRLSPRNFRILYQKAKHTATEKHHCDKKLLCSEESFTEKWCCPIKRPPVKAIASIHAIVWQVSIKIHTEHDFCDLDFFLSFSFSVPSLLLLKMHAVNKSEKGRLR